jgi:hypothetical protein
MSVNFILTVVYGLVNYLILKKIILNDYFSYKKFFLISVYFFLFLLLIKFFYFDEYIKQPNAKKIKIIYLTLISYGTIFFNAIKFLFDEAFTNYIQNFNIKKLSQTKEKNYRRTQSIIAFSCISTLQLFYIWKS